MFLRKLKKRLENNFGKIPDPMYFAGDMQNIKSYYVFRKVNDLDAFLIDDITWNDLNMDRIFKRINPGLSTSGEQYLYYVLRSPAIDADVYHERKKLIDLMSEWPELRLKLQVILAQLGRTRCADLSVTFHPEDRGNHWLIVYILCALLVPVAVASVAFIGKFGMVACIGTLLLNALMHEFRIKKCRLDFATVNYTVSTIFALHKIRKLKNAQLDQSFQDSYECLDRLKSVIRIGGMPDNSDGGIWDFLSTIFLVDLIQYELIKNKLADCRSL